MLPEAQMVALTRRYQRRLAAISTTAGTAVATVWDGLDNYDKAAVPIFARRTTVAFTAAKAASIATSVGFISLLLTERPRSVDPRLIEVPLPIEDPFIAYWKALTADHVWAEAVEIGRHRAQATVADYVTSTSRRTGDTAVASVGQKIVGWRRCLTSVSCAWCATVATQRYRTAESADFGHNRCDCTVVPIIGDADPGRVINEPVLSTLKQQGQSYWKAGYVNPDGSPAPRADAVPSPA